MRYPLNGLLQPQTICTKIRDRQISDPLAVFFPLASRFCTLTCFSGRVSGVCRRRCRSLARLGGPGRRKRTHFFRQKSARQAATAVLPAGSRLWSSKSRMPRNPARTPHVNLTRSPIRDTQHPAARNHPNLLEAPELTRQALGVPRLLSKRVAWEGHGLNGFCVPTDSPKAALRCGPLWSFGHHPWHRLFEPYLCFFLSLTCLLH